MHAITDAARTDLHNRVRDVLGEQEGDTLMAHLPPVGWADVATKQDMVLLRKDLDGFRLSLKADMERGFRRQAMWIIGALFVQQGVFGGLVVYLVERLAP